MDTNKNTLSTEVDRKIKLIANSFGLDKVVLDELLSKHVSTNLGGVAKLFFAAFNSSEIIRMVNMARGLKVPVLIFGSGTKMLISENGFDGVAIKNRTSKMTVVGVKGKIQNRGVGVDEALIEVDSGVLVSKLVEFLKGHGLTFEQLENTSGTLGGNLFLNKDLLQICQSVKVIDEDGEIEDIEKNELSLRKHIILSAVFKCKTRIL